MSFIASTMPAACCRKFPRRLTVTTSLTQQNGYYRTTSSTTSLSGKANAIDTRSVLVNGVAATWTQWSASWSLSTVALNPGINRIVIQALDGAGKEVERIAIDVWRDTGTMTNVSGTLPTGTTTWSPASGPYHVTANITVPEGATLVIQPGTTVFFEPNTGITIQGGRIGYTDGRLLAEGTDTQRIRFARTPTATGNWAGITFSTLRTSGWFKATADRADNRITYADLDRANSAGHSIHAVEAKLLMDHLDFVNQTSQMISMAETSFTLSNSRIPSITNTELTHIAGFPDDGVVEMIGNWFGTSTGYNDIIDVAGEHATMSGTPASPTVAKFLNNIFTGGSDDGIDIDACNVLVEGNVFMNFHSDDPSRDSKSHAVTTGEEYGIPSRHVVTRNLFYDVDHAIIAKDDGFLTITQNTFVHITMAAVNLYEFRDPQWPGDGVYMDGNIFYDVAKYLRAAHGHISTALSHFNRYQKFHLSDYYRRAGHLGGE